MSGVEVISQESEEWPTTGGTAYPSPMDQGTVASGAHLDTAGQRRHWQRRATDKAAQCLADSTTTTTALQHVHTVCNFTCLLSSRVSDHIRPTRRIGRRTDWEHGPL